MFQFMNGEGQLENVDSFTYFVTAISRTGNYFRTRKTLMSRLRRLFLLFYRLLEIGNCLLTLWYTPGHGGSSNVKLGDMKML